MSSHQFVYCSLCKTNYKQRKLKHVYSKKHQEVLHIVLEKFLQKVILSWILFLRIKLISSTLQTPLSKLLELMRIFVEIEVLILRKTESG